MKPKRCSIGVNTQASLRSITDIGSQNASLKLQNPRATHEQLVQTLRANEHALRDRAWQQGISPCAKIEALGRSRYILPQAEREQLAERQRRARAEAERKQEQAAQADYDRRRSQ